MTHSLHRKGDKDNLCNDYVMLIMPGMNRMKLESVQENMKGIWDILSRYEAELVNFGTLRGGGRHRKTIDEFKKTPLMIIHAVFIERETLQACLNEIKEKDVLYVEVPEKHAKLLRTKFAGRLTESANRALKELMEIKRQKV